jgi:hypothetical protein
MALVGWSIDVGKWGATMADRKHGQAVPAFPQQPFFTREEWQKMPKSLRQKILNYSAEVTGFKIKAERHHRLLK